MAVSEDVDDRIAARRARAAAALVRLGAADAIWHLLQYSPDPRSRSALINALHPLGVDPATLADELEAVLESTDTGALKLAPARQKNAFLFDPVTSKRRGLLLSLATYPAADFELGRREDLLTTIEELYRDDPDSGVHAAAELVLTRWGRQKLPKLESGSPRSWKEARRRWYVSAAGLTMVLVDGPIDFNMGSPSSEPTRQKHEVLHRRVIPHRFAIAERDVTVAEFARYFQETHGSPFDFEKDYSPDPDGPQISVSWIEGALFCNWLGDKEVPPLPRCYVRNDRGEIRVDAAAVAAGGYRLPLSSEWEYACRAGSETSRYYGNSPELLGNYEWYIATSGFRAHSCGRLLPNDMGLFDMLGNVYKWCHDRVPNPEPDLKIPIRDDIKAEVVAHDQRVLRGETFGMIPAGLRSAYRTGYEPAASRPDIGFRPARTMP